MKDLGSAVISLETKKVKGDMNRRVLSQHTLARTVEAEGPEPIHKFMSSIQSLGNVKMKFIRAFTIDEMRKMV